MDTHYIQCNYGWWLVCKQLLTELLQEIWREESVSDDFAYATFIMLYKNKGSTILNFPREISRIKPKIMDFPGKFPAKIENHGFSREISRENERGFYIQILNGEMSSLISLN